MVEGVDGFSPELELMTFPAPDGENSLNGQCVVLGPVVHEGIAAQVARTSVHYDVTELIPGSRGVCVEVCITAVSLQLPNARDAGGGRQAGIAVVDGRARITKIRPVVCRTQIVILVEPGQVDRIRCPGLQLS